MVDNLVFDTRMSYSEILKANRDLALVKQGREFTVEVLSNITVNPLKEILDFSVRKMGLSPAVNFGNYDNIVQDSFGIGSPDVVMVFYELINFNDGFEVMAELYTDAEVTEAIEKIQRDLDIIFANLASKPLVLFNTFSALPLTGAVSASRNIDKIESALNEYLLANKPASFKLVDIKRIMAYVGTENAIDYRKYEKYKSLYKIDFFKHYVHSVQPLLLRRAGKLKKALIFDCDNTLWKGIIGEDGPEGIEMSAAGEKGKYFHLVQKIAVDLSKKGVLICLCSKNNPADVDELLANHPDMVLRAEHIVSRKVNWTTKDENLRALAAELNIGLDSFVFVDDSPFELNLIKTNVPEVTTIAVPADPAAYPVLLLDAAQRYFNLEPLADDLARVSSYKAQALRAEAMSQIGNVDSYLATLETRIRIARNPADQLQRIAQLTQKTNQFNLTTRRYTETEVQEFLQSPEADVYSVDVSDKYGNSGITGVIIVKDKNSPQGAHIDTFLLSCRVLGRRIEDAFLGYVIENCRAAGINQLNAAYLKTMKNAQVENYYERHGFEVVTADESSKKYRLDLPGYQPVAIGFIDIVTEQ